MPKPSISNRYNPLGSHCRLATVSPIAIAGMIRAAKVVNGDVPPNSSALRKVAITEFSKRAVNGQAQTMMMSHSSVSMIFTIIAAMLVVKSHKAMSINPVAASTDHMAVATGKFLLNAEKYVRSRYPRPSFAAQAAS